jgi:hypothetical protein
MQYFTKKKIIVPPVVLVLSVCAYMATASLIGGQALRPPFDVERIERATVLVMQTQLISGKPVITCLSSGTLVSRDGLILTNAHTTVTSADCPGDTLMIALSIRLDEPPVNTYQAQIIQADEGVDLALLRIHREFDGRVINPADLALPFVDLGDSDAIALDETLWVVGYPGIGDDPIMLVRSLVLGFTAEPSGGDRSWFKVGVDPSGDLTEIAGMMSGGGAYNRSGQLVGIPTTAPITQRTAVTECKLLQDTTGDGLINPNDRCIAIGGSINALRPSNFVRPLLRSASLGLRVETLVTTSVRSSEPALPVITNLFFASSVTNNMPVSVIGSLPAGNNSLYLFFDYANMTPQTVYELRVAIRGRPNAILSLAPVRWSGGERGLWYIGTTGTTLPNGDYEFTLFVNGLAAAPPLRITVGGAPQPTPTFSSIAFGIVEGDQIFGDGYILGTGTTVNARFIFNNMREGLPWTAIWYYNDTELSPRGGGNWSIASATGVFNVSFEGASGMVLPPGRYRLVLGIDGRLAALSDFTIAGAQGSANPRIFSQTRFAVADSVQEAIASNPMTSFTNEVNSLYLLFKWEQISPGTPWQIRWFVDGMLFYNQLVPWAYSESAATNEWLIMRLTGGERVPDGTYRVQLLVNNIIPVSYTHLRAHET